MQVPLGVYASALSTLSDREQAQLQLNSGGSLKVGGHGGRKRPAVGHCHPVLDRRRHRHQHGGSLGRADRVHGGERDQGLGPYHLRPPTNVPFGPGGDTADNSAFNISAAATIELVGVLSFIDKGWRNQAGDATAAGAQVWQTTSFVNRPFASFNLAGMSSQKPLGLLQAQNAWNPGNVVNTFDFALDVDAD